MRVVLVWLLMGDQSAVSGTRRSPGACRPRWPAACSQPWKSPDMCGDTITLGRSHHGDPGGSGSSVNTSSAAPPIVPARSADCSAPSSASAPRPTLISQLPGCIRASSAGPIRPRVDSVRGSARMTKSAPGSRPGSSVSALTGPATGSFREWRATHCAERPQLVSMRAMARPIPPAPRITARRPASRFVSRCRHSRPACSRRVPGRSTVIADTRASVYSAIAASNTPAALVTTTELSTSSGNSSQSTPAVGVATQRSRRLQPHHSRSQSTRSHRNTISASAASAASCEPAEINRIWYPGHCAGSPGGRASADVPTTARTGGSAFGRALSTMSPFFDPQSFSLAAHS
jgi:hypothetical protein